MIHMNHGNTRSATVRPEGNLKSHHDRHHLCYPVTAQDNTGDTMGNTLRAGSDITCDTTHGCSNITSDTTRVVVT